MNTYKNIAFVTPWNAPCGVAEYGAGIVSGLLQEDAELKFNLLVNFPCNEYDNMNVYKTEVTEGTSSYVSWRCFEVGHSGKKRFTPPAGLTPDLVLVNYQSYLYPALQELLQWLHEMHTKGAKIRIILHDSCVDGSVFNSNYEYFTLGPEGHGAKRIHHGIYTPDPKLTVEEAREALMYDQAKTVVSFGLGRCQTKQVMSVTQKLGINYLVHFSKGEDSARVQQEAFEYPEDKVWVETGYCSIQRLLKFIECGDAVVLWYPETDAIVSSSAARLAISAQRPLFVNRTNWFRDLGLRESAGYPNLCYFFSNEKELEDGLLKLKTDHLVANSIQAQQAFATDFAWSKVALPLVEKT